MITVEVVYALPQHQFVTTLQLPLESTVKDAIEQSGILEQFPEINLSNNKIGIFSQRVSLERQLSAGDRVEIYRPLQVDPKQKRRNLAAAKAIKN